MQSKENLNKILDPTKEDLIIKMAETKLCDSV